MQIGTLQIEMFLSSATKSVLNSLNQACSKGRVSQILAGKKAQITQKGRRGFDLNKLKGNIKLTKSITLRPFERKLIDGMTKVRGISRQ